MTTESQQQIAREARDQIRTYFNKPFYLPKPIDEEDKVFVIILSSIERATMQTKPGEITDLCYRKGREAAQPQRSEQQEWTPGEGDQESHVFDAQGKCIGCADSGSDAVLISDAHNTALAVEREGLLVHELVAEHKQELAEVREQAFSEGWLRACVFYVDIDAEMPDHDCSKQLRIRLDALVPLNGMKEGK